MSNGFPGSRPGHTGGIRRHVYLIGAPASSVVKIGTAINAKRRLQAIQVSSPIRLEVRWETLGGRPLEQSLHDAFDQYRIQGEWFDFGPLNPVVEVKRHLDLLRRTNPVELGMDAPGAESDKARGGSINESHPLPAMAQLAELLRADIIRNNYPDGYQIPSPSELAAEYEVSISVVKRALRELSSEGLITAQQGRRSTVRRPERHLRDGSTRHLRSQRAAEKAALEAEAERQGQRRTSRFIDVSNVPAPPGVAEALGMRKGDRVLRRRYIFDLNGVPAESCSSYFRHDLATGTALTEPGDIPGGAHNLLAEQLGFDLTHAPEVLFARMPTPSEVRDLRLLPGTPVVELFRTFMTRDEQCVEASVWVFAGDRHEFRYVTPMD